MSHHKTLWMGDWFVDINPYAVSVFGREYNNKALNHHNNNHKNRRHKRSSRVGPVQIHSPNLSVVWLWASWFLNLTLENNEIYFTGYGEDLVS